MLTFTYDDNEVNSFDPFFLDDEDDDVNPLIPRYDEVVVDDGYLFSVEQEEEMSRHLRECPKATEWDDMPLDELNDVTVIIDRARKQDFNQAKSEIDILQKGW